MLLGGLVVWKQACVFYKQTSLLCALCCLCKRRLQICKAEIQWISAAIGQTIRLYKGRSSSNDVDNRSPEANDQCAVFKPPPLTSQQVFGVFDADRDPDQVVRQAACCSGLGWNGGMAHVAGQTDEAGHAAKADSGP